MRKFATMAVLAMIFTVLNHGLAIAAVTADKSAEKSTDADLKTLTKCLEAKKETRNCFFAVYEPCLAAEKDRAANPSQAKAWCEMRETAAWQFLKDEASQRLEKQLPEPELGEFQQILENWKNDGACEFRSRHYRPMYWFFTNPATCMMRKTHYEAETVLDYEAMFKNRNFEFQRAEKGEK